MNIQRVSFRRVVSIEDLEQRGVLLHTEVIALAREVLRNPVSAPSIAPILRRIVSEAQACLDQLARIANEKKQ